jgi:DNA photolyase.
MKNILWFTNDLRLQDNEMVRAAFEDRKEMIALYVFNPRDYSPGGHYWTQFEGLAPFSKVGMYRTKFILEALSDLQKQLAVQEFH